MAPGSGRKYLKIISSLFRRRSTLPYELSELYGPSANRPKGILLELIKEKAEIASQSGVARKLRDLKGFYTMEISPPTAGEELEKLKSDLSKCIEFMKDGCYKYMTVSQAWLLVLVVTEVCLWFFLGETIGKMHIVGYKV